MKHILVLLTTLVSTTTFADGVFTCNTKLSSPVSVTFKAYDSHGAELGASQYSVFEFTLNGKPGSAEVTSATVVSNRGVQMNGTASVGSKKYDLVLRSNLEKSSESGDVYSDRSTMVLSASDSSITLAGVSCVSVW